MGEGKILLKGDCFLTEDELVSSLSWRIAKTQMSIMRRKALSYKCHLTVLQAKKAKDILESEFERDLKLSELARELRMSEFHFARSFTSYFGIAPHQYILSLRMQKAITLLNTSSMNHTEVAIASGFKSHSQFNKMMKRQIGRVPSKVRNKFLE